MPPAFIKATRQAASTKRVEDIP